MHAMLERPARYVAQVAPVDPTLSPDALVRTGVPTSDAPDAVVNRLVRRCDGCGAPRSAVVVQVTPTTAEARCSSCAEARTAELVAKFAARGDQACRRNQRPDTEWFHD